MAAPRRRRSFRPPRSRPGSETRSGRFPRHPGKRWARPARGRGGSGPAPRFDASRPLEREVLESGDRPVDLRQAAVPASRRDRQRRCPARHGSPRGRDRASLRAQGDGRPQPPRRSRVTLAASKREDEVLGVGRPAALTDHPPNGTWWPERGRGRQSCRAGDKAATCPCGESRLMIHPTTPDAC